MGATVSCLCITWVHCGQLPLNLPADHGFALARPVLRTELPFHTIFLVSEISDK